MKRGQSDGGIFSIEVFSSQIALALACVKLTKVNQHIEKSKKHSEPVIVIPCIIIFGNNRKIKAYLYKEYFNFPVIQKDDYVYYLFDDTEYDSLIHLFDN